MTPTLGLLENWRYTIGIFLFCSYTSFASWLRIAKYARFPHDPVTIFGLTAAIVITASITYRSPLSADRVVFGVATAALVLMAVRMMPLTPLVMFGVEAAESFMWTAAAATCLIALVRGLNSRRRQ
jgi:hypothetical protein